MKPNELSKFDTFMLKIRFPRIKKNVYIKQLEQENKKLKEELETINKLISCEADYESILEVLRIEKI